uniref:Serrate RNA effector molecule homolog n=2 Tax=Proconiini TaxID=565685 RepID=A0A1B6EMZ7_9HEMI
MGDSDDEYGDRKRRDKFRGERTESYRSGEGRREDRRRDEWIERDTWGGGRSRARGDYRGTVRERYSPARQHDFSPPPKRIRTEWEDRRMPYTDTSYNYSSSWGQETQAPYSNNSQRTEQVETQPPMLSLKAFLQSQDDNISDEEAIRKYNEYKLEFRRQQLNEFFVAHKEEEWFKLKYHPEESIKRKEEQSDALKRRVEVFMEFLENGRLDKVTVDAEQSELLIKLLDAVVIRLEGGTDLDLEILDEVPVPAPTPVQSTSDDDTKPVIKKEPVDDDEKDKEATDGEVTEEGESVMKKTEDSNKEGDEKVIVIKTQDSPESSLPTTKESTDDKNMSSIDDTEPVSLNGGTEEEDEDKQEQSPVQEQQNIADDEMSVDEGECDVEKKKEEEIMDKSEKTDKGKIEEIDEKKEDDNSPKPRPLHRTASIFLRNLAPTITKQEVEAMCKRYPGFLRVAIADPQPDRRWFRRGWVTFQRDVNIKEICWNLNNIRLRDCELGAIVNRDLSRRIRTVTGLTGHKQVLRHDLKLGAKIIHNLDAKTNLWQDDKPQPQQSFGLVSKNPVLRNITDYLIEEASAEEEELLGQASETEDNDEKDQAMIKVLDRLLLYLRIVHSVDYYNHCEYPNEDEMPNRCGIMHARGSSPTSKVTSQEIQEYCRGFAQKMACLINSCGDVEGQELISLGAKEAESEVEKFVAANTQELAKDKWLCPLSGKKFKGPEFVRKHIFNKHAEKIEEVKKEVEYFNNYLRDPKRPMLPEHPGNRSTKKEPAPDHSAPSYFQYGGYGGGRGYQHYGGGYGGYPSGYSRPGRGGFSRGGRGVSDYRPVIHYRDLDAPREPDEFI